MAIERDPRVDPIPGDVIQWRDIIVRIQRCTGGIVYYQCRYAGDAQFRTLAAAHLQQYRRWAKDAEVLGVGSGD